MIKHRIPLPAEARRLIDEFMPTCDVSEYHETTVRAPMEKVYAALRTADLGDSPIVRLLLRLRGLGSIRDGQKKELRLNLDAIIRGGFVLLGESPPNEIALGVIGRFWTLAGGRYRISADEFTAFDLPGYARAVWNFSLVEGSEGITRLATETRVQCTDDASRRRFRLYWTVIAPFSGLIRREALRAIRKRSEAKV